MKMMKRVARRVTLSLSEAKRFTILNDRPFTVAAGGQSVRWAYKNIFSQLPTATGSLAGSSYGVDGNEIVDLLWKAKIAFSIDYGSILSTAADSPLAYGTVMLHVYLVAANDYTSSVADGGTPPGSLTWTNYPAQFSATDPGWFLTQNGYRPTLNGNNVKVVKAWHKRYNPDIVFERFAAGDTNVDGRGVIVQRIDVKHKFRGKKTFEDAPLADTDANFLRAGTLRGWNYYLLVGWAAPAVISTVSNQPFINMDQYLYFKDP